MAKKKDKGEWHLFSASALTGALTFISVQSTSSGSTPQVMAVAFCAIVLTILVSSENWKDQHKHFHISMATLAIFVLATWLIWKIVLQVKNSQQIQSKSPQ